MNEYVTGMRPVFSRRAVFSDETPYYRRPFEPKEGDETAIRIRTLKNNVDEVFLISGSLRLPMHLTESRDGFDYYEANITVGTETISYYFEIIVGEMNCFYNKLGVTRELSDAYAFRIVPGFSVPAWARGAVMDAEGVTTDSDEYQNILSAVLTASGYSTESDAAAAGISEQMIDITVSYYTAYDLMVQKAKVTEVESTASTAASVAASTAASTASSAS